MGGRGSFGGIFFGRGVEVGLGVFAEGGGDDPAGVEGVDKDVGLGLSGMEEFDSRGSGSREGPCDAIAFDVGGKRVGDRSFDPHGVIKPSQDRALGV